MKTPQKNSWRPLIITLDILLAILIGGGTSAGMSYTILRQRQQSAINTLYTNQIQHLKDLANSVNASSELATSYDAFSLGASVNKTDSWQASTNQALDKQQSARSTFCKSNSLQQASTLTTPFTHLQLFDKTAVSHFTMPDTALASYQATYYCNQTDPGSVALRWTIADLTIANKMSDLSSLTRSQISTVANDMLQFTNYSFSDTDKQALQTAGVWNALAARQSDVNAIVAAAYQALTTSTMTGETTAHANFNIAVEKAHSDGTADAFNQAAESFGKKRATNELTAITQRVKSLDGLSDDANNSNFLSAWKAEELFFAVNAYATQNNKLPITTASQDLLTDLKNSKLLDGGFDYTNFSYKRTSDTMGTMTMHVGNVTDTFTYGSHQAPGSANTPAPQMT